MRLSYPDLDEAIANPTAYTTLFDDGKHYLIFKHAARGPLRTPIIPQVARLFTAYKNASRQLAMTSSLNKTLRAELAAAKSQLS